MLLPQSFPEHFQHLYLPNFTPPTFKEKKWTHKNKQAEEIPSTEYSYFG